MALFRFHVRTVLPYTSRIAAALGFASRTLRTEANIANRCWHKIWRYVCRSTLSFSVFPGSHLCLRLPANSPTWSSSCLWQHWSILSITAVKEKVLCLLSWQQQAAILIQVSNGAESSNTVRHSVSSFSSTRSDFLVQHKNDESQWWRRKIEAWCIHASLIITWTLAEMSRLLQLWT